MRQLKKDEFRSYKKGLRKCDKQKREMQKKIAELTQQVKDLQELNRKYYNLLDNLLDKLERVKCEPIRVNGNTIIF